MKALTLIITLFVVFILKTNAQEVETYKTIDTTSLKITIIKPVDFDKNKIYPGMVFYFGGGWKGGSIKQFKPHADYFSSRGIVCFLVNYRIKSKNNTTPFESVKDAKSTMRCIRANAVKFNIDPNKIIASGGSAGGHLAASTALITKYNEEGDDLSVSPIPNALVLFNPVIDNGPGGYGFERIGEEYPYFSPLHNIRKNAPPTTIFLGTKDNLIPVVTGEYYKMVMEKVGSRCDLHLFEGEGHGFFNKGKKNDCFTKTVILADKFLASVGFIKGEPTIKTK